MYFETFRLSGFSGGGSEKRPLQKPIEDYSLAPATVSSSPGLKIPTVLGSRLQKTLKIARYKIDGLVSVASCKCNNRYNGCKCNGTLYES